MKTAHRKRVKIAGLIGTNVILIVLMIVLFLIYRDDYIQKMVEQNINDVTNINHSAANIASGFLGSQLQKMEDIQKYQERHQLDKAEFLQYVCDSNSNEQNDFQLIGEDYTGYRISVEDAIEFVAVDYHNNNYANLHSIFNGASEGGKEVYFSSEFTDNYSGLKSIAFCAYFDLEREDGAVESYTLMSVYKTAHFEKLLQLDGGFDRLATVLVNENGDYILSNRDFRDDNFYQFLYAYNGLSRDEILQIQDEVCANETGVLHYLNVYGEESVYVYASVEAMGWYSISCVPISSFHGNGYDVRFTMLLMGLLVLLMAFDGIWLIEMNRRLKMSALEAQTANSAKTDFLSNMSHDIRTPINVIIGMTELAQLEDNSQQTGEYLNNIQSSGKFLLGLVNDILDLDKVESGKMELHPKPYTFYEFEKHIRAVIGPMCEEKKITFSITGNGVGTALKMDILRVNQIIFNLLSNAVKFTAPGGRISLDCRLAELENNRAEVFFRVQDNGIGMSEEFQKRMFDAFSQERRAMSPESAGTGLGLAIVHRLVNLMNGSIEVESQQGKGTTFHIRLEAEQLGEDIPHEEEQSYDPADLQGKRVLLCEDHPLNTKIAVKLLENRGMQVECAVNGAVGVDKFSNSETGYFDLILMDIRMPVMDGFEAIRVIRGMTDRADAAGIPIIALTANAYDTDVQQCLDAGANAHLSKPIDSALLYDTLARYLMMRQ